MDNSITHLSFSRIKQLLHSPAALWKYIHEKPEPTQAMVQGQLLDCLLFTPDDFNARFYVYQKPDLRTKEGKAIAEAAKAEAGERLLISTADYNQAQLELEGVRSCRAVKALGLLDGFDFQKKIEFEREGIHHIGYADAYKEEGDKVVIWDLKRMGGKSGQTSVRYAIRDGMYHLQAAIYLHKAIQAGKQVAYYIISVSEEGYVTPFEIGLDSIYQVDTLWLKAINAAHEINFAPELFAVGPEYWADDIVFQF